MFYLDFGDVERLQDAIKNFSGNAENAINEVLHSQEVSELAYEKIKYFMPVSGKRWKGKKPAAKTGKSLRSDTGNLSLTVRSTKAYQYLYFPNDGTNTKRHAGQQFFFERGGEAAQSEIVERCINKLINNFEEGV